MIAIESSGKALAATALHKTKFEALSVGTSFSVSFDLASRAAVSSKCSRMNKAGEPKYTVVIHAEHKCYEVARIL